MLPATPTHKSVYRNLFVDCKLRNEVIGTAAYPAGSM